MGYYEEKVVKGVVHVRSTPNGEWTPMTREGLTKMIVGFLEKHGASTKYVYRYDLLEKQRRSRND